MSLSFSFPPFWCWTHLNPFFPYAPSNSEERLSSGPEFYRMWKPLQGITLLLESRLRCALVTPISRLRQQPAQLYVKSDKSANASESQVETASEVLHSNFQSKKTPTKIYSIYSKGSTGSFRHAGAHILHNLFMKASHDWKILLILEKFWNASVHGPFSLFQLFGD